MEGEGGGGGGEEGRGRGGGGGGCSRGLTWMSQTTFSQASLIVHSPAGEVVPLALLRP